MIPATGMHSATMGMKTAKLPGSMAPPSTPAQLGKHRRERLDEGPPGALHYGLDRNLVEIAIEHGLALLRQRWPAVVLLLPHGLAVRQPPRAAQRGAERTAERPETHELVAPEPRRELGEEVLARGRRDQVI